MRTVTSGLVTLEIRHLKPNKWQNLKLDTFVVFKPVCRYDNKSVGLIRKYGSAWIPQITADHHRSPQMTTADHYRSPDSLLLGPADNLITYSRSPQITTDYF